jgi:dephospho-CoA kinase
LAIEQSQTWMTNQHHFAYAIKEAALLFESKSDVNLDAIICVVAFAEQRIERTMLRDNVSEKQVIQRMNLQWSEEEKAAKSDFVIYNDDDDELLPQVVEVHQELLKLAKKSKQSLNIAPQD